MGAARNQIARPKAKAYMRKPIIATTATNLTRPTIHYRSFASPATDGAPQNSKSASRLGGDRSQGKRRRCDTSVTSQRDCMQSFRQSLNPAIFCGTSWRKGRRNRLPEAARKLVENSNLRTCVSVIISHQSITIYSISRISRNVSRSSLLAEHGELSVIRLNVPNSRPSSVVRLFVLNFFALQI
jgi:hypothetical protein